MDPIGQWLSESARPTSGPALSVGCERAVRVGLERRCWAGHAGPSCQRVRAVSGKKEKEKGSWAVGAGLGQGEWCWAVAWGLGRSVKELAREGKRENGPQWRFAGPNWVWVVFCFLFLFLIQTITHLGEFKFNFEFTTSTQTNKLMHQHECNTNN